MWRLSPLRSCFDSIICFETSYKVYEFSLCTRIKIRVCMSFNLCLLVVKQKSRTSERAGEQICFSIAVYGKNSIIFLCTMFKTNQGKFDKELRGIFAQLYSNCKRAFPEFFWLEKDCLYRPS